MTASSTLQPDSGSTQQGGQIDPALGKLQHRKVSQMVKGDSQGIGLPIHNARNQHPAFFFHVPIVEHQVLLFHPRQIPVRIGNHKRNRFKEVADGIAQAVRCGDGKDAPQQLEAARSRRRLHHFQTYGQRVAVNPRGEGDGCG